ncbi:BP74-related protein [Streptomyces sp. NPDC002446]
MRGITTKVGILTAAALLALTAAGAAQGKQAGSARDRAAADDSAAYFEFTTYGYGHPAPAVVKITNPELIAHARALVNGETDERPHLVGRIAKTRAPYNPNWSFHFRPETVDFFDYAIEVCDASLPYVEEHLDEAGGAFLPGLVWCPWSSRLTKEVPAP